MSVDPRVIHRIVFTRLLIIWLLLPHAFCCVRLILIQIDDVEDPWKNLKRNLDPDVPQITNYLVRPRPPFASSLCWSASGLERVC